MTNQILLKRSAVQNKIPLVTDLAFGELGVNTFDGKAYLKANAGASDFIVDLTANQTVTVSGDATGTGTNAIALTLANSGVVAGTYDNTTTANTPFTVDAKGRITSVGANVTITPAFSSITGKPTTLVGYGVTDAVNVSSLGAASGVATLDVTGKVPTAQLPASVLGGMSYQGTWNATTNIPAITSSTGTKGYYYKVSNAGSTSIDGNSNWTVGDMIVFNGTTWDIVQGGATDVSSVFGRVGTVVLLNTDVTSALGFTPYNATNPSNFISGNQVIAVTGDATGSGTTGIALTLAASGVTAGTYNNSVTAHTPFTVDAKGRITSTGAAVTVTPAFASITAKPSTVAGYGITDAMLTSQVIDGGTF